LFALVFVSRYLDLFTNFISVYNTVIKIVFLVSSIATVYLMFTKFKASNDSNHDTFRCVTPRGQFSTNMGLPLVVNLAPRGELCSLGYCLPLRPPQA
jgi:hypothetical protein